MSQSHSSSRRNFLKGAGLASAVSVLSGQSAMAAAACCGNAAKAKNLIFLVADGMGTGTLSLAQHWQQRHQDQSLHWLQLFERETVVRAMQDTASASSPVTDSAAAGSAWGCGQRVNNRSINYSTSGEPLKPLCLFAKEAGKATGLVSTCRITHATPAAFAANVPQRDAEDDIADQYLQREIDVYLGGGLRHFKRKDTNLIPSFEKKGYQVAQTKDELAELAGQPRLLGLFTQSHVPYAIDRLNDPKLADVPGLEAMFQAALTSLSQHPNGFVLQVEAGRVDHAGHANDPAAILHEQLEFDRCIPIALEFLKEHPDTLIIVTTDHGTGGCQLNGIGKGYNGSGPALDRIDRFRGSFESVENRFKKSGEFDVAYFESITGIQVSDTKLQAIHNAIAAGAKYLTSTLADLLADELMQATAVGWTSHNHTSEHVELAALGPGSESVPMFLENNQLHGIMRAALGI